MISYAYCSGWSMRKAADFLLRTFYIELPSRAAIVDICREKETGYKVTTPAALFFLCVYVFIIWHITRVEVKV